jgi:hypothetical protein
VPSSRESALVSLERRLSQLEQLVGRSADGLALWEEVQHVKQSLEVLEGGRLDELVTKFRAAAESIASYERERRINPTSSNASIASPVITEAQVKRLLYSCNVNFLTLCRSNRCLILSVAGKPSPHRFPRLCRD